MADNVIRARPEVVEFTEAMEFKLQKNDHKGGWDNKTLSKLFSLLEGEVQELKEAVMDGVAEDIQYEAADVANFAMMIAWKVRHQHKEKHDGKEKG